MLPKKWSSEVFFRGSLIYSSHTIILELWGRSHFILYITIKKKKKEILLRVHKECLLGVDLEHRFPAPCCIISLIFIALEPLEICKSSGDSIPAMSNLSTEIDFFEYFLKQWHIKISGGSSVIVPKHYHAVLPKEISLKSG